MVEEEEEVKNGVYGLLFTHEVRWESPSTGIKKKILSNREKGGRTHKGDDGEEGANGNIKKTRRR